MTDPILDLFDEHGLFDGGLEGLTEESFSVGSVSLVDELSLNSDFEPLQAEPMGSAKPSGPPAPFFSQQNLCLEGQLGCYDAAKGGDTADQSFSGEDALVQHSQFQLCAVQQAEESDTLFPDSSPMWGNQDLSGDPLHQVAPQHQGHRPPIEQHHHLQQPQRHLDHQVLPQSDFAFYPDDPSQKPLQTARHEPTRRHSPFCHVGGPNAQPPFLDTPSALLSDGLPQQEVTTLSHQIGQSSYPGSTPADHLSFYSVSGAVSVTPSDPVQACKGQHQQQGPIHLAEGCPLRATQHSRPVPEGYSGAGLFPESLDSYSAAVSQLLSDHPGESGPCPPPALSSNGYQGLDESLLQQVGTHGSGFEELEPHDLLGDDLLPQLESALSPGTSTGQPESFSCPWMNGRNEAEEENPFSIYCETEVRYICLFYLIA